MSKAAERYGIGYERLLADPARHYEQTILDEYLNPRQDERFLADPARRYEVRIKRNEDKIKRYEGFIEKLKAKNVGLEALKKAIEQGSTKIPDPEGR